MLMFPGLMPVFSSREQMFAEGLTFFFFNVNYHLSSLAVDGGVTLSGKQIYVTS